MSFGRIATILVLLGSIALLVMFGYKMTGSGSSSRVQGGIRVNEEGAAVNLKPRPASPFTLTSFSGEKISLEDLRGKVVVLNFWSSWCDPCKEEAPVLEEVWRKYKDRNVVFVGANTWDDKPDAQQFLLENGITYPNGTSEDGLATEYGLTGIPETFVIDANGTVVRRWFGPLEAEQLSDLIDVGLASDPSTARP